MNIYIVAYVTIALFLSIITFRFDKSMTTVKDFLCLFSLSMFFLPAMIAILFCVAWEKLDVWGTKVLNLKLKK